MGDKFKNISNSKITNRSKVIINETKDDSTKKESSLSKDDLLFKSEQKRLVSQNEYKVVFSNLKVFLDRKRDVNKLNELIQLESRFNSLSEKIRFSIISTEDSELLQNRITYFLLELIDNC